MLEAAAATGTGVLIDVTGKWSAFELSGPGAARLLAFTIDIDAVLAGRECAAVTLMDCPAIIARSGDGFRLWVQASYATHFLDTAEQCGAALRREPGLARGRSAVARRGSRAAAIPSPHPPSSRHRPAGTRR